MLFDRMACFSHTVNGQVLPSDHGYPLRLVERGNCGHDWIKWVKRI
ncbi:MAG: molybdopterin-dependent oxidoreductase [Dehalococcoidia bacterium]|nr:molybdopterin-dependent oxidoreductase [Dehalococcoidia bacterium]